MIVLEDFAEHYSFLVQDEIQGYHWNKSQCSLHPVAVCISSSDNLVESSLCILSEDLNHDVTFVYIVIKETVVFIKKELNPSMKILYYFSDGWAAQYKNCKHFVILCHHLTDFSIDCMWNVFAAGHKKSCDGIRGTVKRLTARANFRRPISSRILSARTMFEFCQCSIHRINFIYTSSDEIDAIRSKLKNWFSLARTIPATWRYHQFVATSTFSIKMKRVSDDNEFESEFNFLGKHAPVQNPS